MWNDCYFGVRLNTAHANQAAIFAVAIFPGYYAYLLKRVNHMSRLYDLQPNPCRDPHQSN